MCAAVRSEYTGVVLCRQFVALMLQISMQVRREQAVQACYMQRLCEIRADATFPGQRKQLKFGDGLRRFAQQEAPLSTAQHVLKVYKM